MAVIGKQTLKKKKNGIMESFTIGFERQSADNLHRVDLEPGINPITIYIAGPFGLRKGKR